MPWLRSARVRLGLLFGRRAAESRMQQEFRFHIDMETERLMQAGGLSPGEARRRALAAFGGVETHKEALRDGRGLAWLGGLSLDLKLGGRMLIKYPMLTIAGGLALAIAIGVGAAWFDLIGKVLAPTIPLPEGNRIVLIETRDLLTSEPEARMARDFLEWRRQLRTVEDLGAFRDATRTLVAADVPPTPLRLAELTAAAFRTARVAPLLGRGLLGSDEQPGAPAVVVLGHDVWRRTFGGRRDVVGEVVQLGDMPATVIGVMPDGFAYPLNHTAWTPLTLGTTYAALEGGALGVIGRLAAGATLAQANAEVRVLGERASAAFPATHEHLRPRVTPLSGDADLSDTTQLLTLNLPVLLVLLIACTSVGTLVYARTATREGQIALRAALGASRGRIVGQLFVEALVLAALATAVGLAAADRAIRWGLESQAVGGGAPFWMTPGLKPTTVLYASLLAIVAAVMLSVLPALRATRTRLQSRIANGGSGATLRFGRLWTAAMIVQVALTAMGIPVAMETVREVRLKTDARAAFPARDYLTAHVDLDRPFDEEATSAFAARRQRAIDTLRQRLEQEPGVVSVTFADAMPGRMSVERSGEIDAPAGSRPPSVGRFRTSTTGPRFFEAFARPIVAGRAFTSGDYAPEARTVLVNEAFARGFARDAGGRSPIGARLRYTAATTTTGSSAPGPWFEIVGVARDMGLDPDDAGREQAQVFHAGAAATMTSVVMSARMRGNPGPLAARLPAMAAAVDARLVVADAQSLELWVQAQNDGLALQAGALAAVTLLVLFLSALGLFSLMSVSVSRRTREIGLRAALGAHPRHVLAGILSHGVALLGTGVAAGAALLVLALALGMGPSGRPADDIPVFAVYLGLTSAVMLGACLIACIGPARRALRINPTEALREA